MKPPVIVSHFELMIDHDNNKTDWEVCLFRKSLILECGCLETIFCFSRWVPVNEIVLWPFCSFFQELSMKWIRWKISPSVGLWLCRAKKMLYTNNAFPLLRLWNLGGWWSFKYTPWKLDSNLLENSLFWGTFLFMNEVPTNQSINRIHRPYEKLAIHHYRKTAFQFCHSIPSNLFTFPSSRIKVGRDQKLARNLEQNFFCNNSPEVRSILQISKQILHRSIRWSLGVKRSIKKCLIAISNWHFLHTWLSSVSKSNCIYCQTILGGWWIDEWLVGLPVVGKLVGGWVTDCLCALLFSNQRCESEGHKLCPSKLSTQEKSVLPLVTELRRSLFKSWGWLFSVFFFFGEKSKSTLISIEKVWKVNTFE